MRVLWIAAMMALTVFCLTGNGQTAGDIPNPAIDMSGYLKIAAEAAAYREKHRLTEDEFIRMSREPGVIVLGASIGSGEFLLGPAAFVRYGLTLLWVTLVAGFLQTVLNMELMRYTIATGEPIFTGFMRTKPRAGFWAWVYSILYFLQIGWPGWAGAAERWLPAPVRSWIFTQPLPVHPRRFPSIGTLHSHRTYRPTRSDSHGWNECQVIAPYQQRISPSRRVRSHAPHPAPRYPSATSAACGPVVGEPGTGRRLCGSESMTSVPSSPPNALRHVPPIRPARFAHDGRKPPCHDLCSIHGHGAKYGAGSRPWQRLKRVFFRSEGRRWRRTPAY